MEEGSKEPGAVIRGSFVLEVRDVRRALFEGARPMLLKVVLFMAAFLVLSQTVQNLSRSAAGAEPPARFIPFAVFALAVPLLSFGFFYNGAKRIFDNTPDRNITWEFDDSGYRVFTPSSDARAAWSTVHHTGEGKTTFLIFQNAAGFQLVPKRAFEPADLPRLRELLRTQVTPKKETKSIQRIFIWWIALIVAFLAIWQFLQAPETKPVPAEDDRTEAQ